MLLVERATARIALRRLRMAILLDLFPEGGRSLDAIASKDPLLSIGVILPTSASTH